MFVIKDCSDFENLKKFNEARKKLIEERLKEKTSNQNFYYGMEKLFEPSSQQQKEINKAIITRNEVLGKTILHGVENYDEITQRNNEILSNLFSPP